MIPYAFRLVFCCLCAAWPLSAAFAAGEYDAARLINNAAEFDGRTVIIRGEAIGNVMRRGTHAWVNVHDGSNALGVWCSVELAGKIGYTGDYRHRGDVVEIKGVFNRHCPEHGGALDIHAQSLRVLMPGAEITRAIAPRKLRGAYAGIVLVILSGLLYLKRRQ